MSMYMNDISVAGGRGGGGRGGWEKKGIRECSKMEVEKKMKYSLNKTKYMVVKKSKGRKKIY